MDMEVDYGWLIPYYKKLTNGVMCYPVHRITVKFYYRDLQIFEKIGGTIFHDRRFVDPFSKIVSQKPVEFQHYYCTEKNHIKSVRYYVSLIINECYVDWVSPKESLYLDKYGKIIAPIELVSGENLYLFNWGNEKAL